MREKQPLEQAHRSPLRRLNYLLNYINDHKPEILEGFIEQLTSNYDMLVASPTIEEDITSLLTDYDHLQKHPNLALKMLNYYLHEFQIPADKDWKKDTLQIPQRNELRAFLGPKYNNVLALTQVLDREKAILLYNDNQYAFYDDVAAPTIDERFETLEEMLSTWWNHAEESPGWTGLVSTKVENGKIYFRKDNCFWDVALDEMSDPELKNSVCCHCDFKGVTLRNENFVLTMPHTIAAGNKYCTGIIHDTRINDDLSHPSEEFFDKLVPGDEV
jgi:hypothetical protein